MKLYLSLFSLILLIEFSTASEKIFTIEGGKIIGESFDDFYAFKGIPYAEPPVDELRFTSPKRFSGKWDGVREFKNYGEVCAQYNHLGYLYEGIEDCLTLNIFVPRTVAESKEKVPVIFFIHGGAFMFGGGFDYGPENIMEAQNMILVTFNYRLGVLGFLSTEDDKIPGNFGLKDQVEALRWVQRNIGNFNGDPKKVTIVGFSAGGASVQLHYMSPLTDGLFNNGISHSGSALDPWVMMENAKEKAHRLASTLGCPQNDHSKLLECLRTKPAKDLVMFAKTLQPFMYNPYSPFGVVVEKAHKDAFLTEHPLKSLKKGHLKKLPWILSQTQDEGLYPSAEFYDEKILETINEKWQDLAPFLLDFNGTTVKLERKQQMALKIKKFYLGIHEISKENFEAFNDIMSDRLFKHGAHIAIQMQSRFANSYFYLFKYKSLDGVAEWLSGNTKDNIGISHGEDVFLIFRNHFRKIPYSEDEKIVAKNLVGLYYNFANSNKAVYGNVVLEKCKIDVVKCLEISSPDDYKIVQLDEQFGNIEFWNDIEESLRTTDRTFYDEL